MQEPYNCPTQQQFSTCLETAKLTNMTLNFPFIKRKKNKRLSLKKYKTGRWDEKEHSQFKRAFMMYGNDWKKVEGILQRRSAEQIRSHSQKLHIKLLKKYAHFKRNNWEIVFENEFERRFMETFRKDGKKVFHIRKVHHYHDRLQCIMRKRFCAKKVFSIVKTTKCGTAESFNFDFKNDYIQNMQQNKKRYGFFLRELNDLKISNDKILRSYSFPDLKYIDIGYTYNMMLTFLSSHALFKAELFNKFCFAEGWQTGYN